MGGGVAGPRLAKAVCDAGGLGMLPIWTMSRDVASDSLNALKKKTRPIAVNINIAFDPSPMLELAVESSVPVIHFFWGDPSPFVARAKSGGAKVMATVSSAADARRARIAGVDILIAQGIEAGGHVFGQTGLMALVPAVVDAGENCPVVAAGAIADGRGLAACLMLGAGGVMIGTALAASEESDAHPDYKQALLNASDGDTVLNTLFDVGWPNAPSRVLRNETARTWEHAGAPAARPGESETIAHSATGSPIPRYSVAPPTRGVTGDIAAMALYAGQGVGLVKRIEPAADILARIVSQAEDLLRTTEF
jgi:nitronate monooxygenase